MGFVDKLLDGAEVAWLPLEAVTEYEQPTKYLVQSTDYDDRFNTPVLTAGKSFILGYTDESAGIYKASISPTIIFDDFTTANKWVDFDFKAKSSAMKMITSMDNQKFVLKYIYYWLNTLPSGLIDGDHKRQWISSFTQKQIPIPCPGNPEKSLAIQSEIVRILDSFTELTAELTSELAARKKQYSHYRNKLLTYEDGGVEWMALGEVLTMRAGQHIKADEISNEPTESHPYICFGGNGVRGYVRNKSHDGAYLLIGRQGALCGNVQRATGPFYATEHAVVVTVSNAINVNWAYHFLTLMNLNQYASQSSLPGLAVGNLLRLEIPVPPLAEQTRVASILDKFDRLTTSISEGLPREIELRRQQYEYYRDLLLRFPKPEEAAEA